MGLKSIRPPNVPEKQKTGNTQDHKIFYSVEECGNCVYATNDSEGLCFKERYCIDFYDGIEYFETIESASAYIGGIIGKDLPPNCADIESAIEDYMEEHGNDDEHWMSFHEYEVLED